METPDLMWWEIDPPDGPTFIAAVNASLEGLDPVEEAAEERFRSRQLRAIHAMLAQEEAEAETNGGSSSLSPAAEAEAAD